MDKPAKPNTPANVLERLNSTFTDLETAALELEGRGLGNRIGQELKGSLTSFLEGYGLLIDGRMPETESELAGILSGHGQQALDGIEGCARLVAKVSNYTYEGDNPLIYLLGLNQVLQGLPLAQLGSTPNKLATPTEHRTVRDRISDAISASGYAVRLGREVPNYMLEMLRETLPGIAGELKSHGQDVYMRFLDGALGYLHGIAVDSMSPSKELPSLEEVAEKLTGIAKEVVPNADYSISNSRFIEYASSPNPVKAFASHFGAPVVAVGAGRERHGIRTNVELYVGDSGSPQRVNVVFHQNGLPNAAVEGLIRLQQECAESLPSSSPLARVNGMAGHLLGDLLR